MCSVFFYDEASALKERMRKRSLKPSESFRKYLRYLKTQDFILPFYFYLGLRLNGLSDIRREEMAHGLIATFTTGWGSGRILNKLLFAGRKVVAEDQSQFTNRSGKACEVEISCGNAAALFACILFYSPFGEAIMDRSPNCDHELFGPGPGIWTEVVKWLRFFFKLCELRKASVRGHL